VKLFTVYSMQSVTATNLPEALGVRLRSMILDGSLPEGRINEVHLAAALGVSRTPLREALMRLVSEGAVTTIPRIGFFVQPLSEEELDQLYPLRAVLDPAALRLSGVPSAKMLDRLRAINRKLATARSAEAAVHLDDQWHRVLLSEANPILLGFIEQLMWRTRRYELALMDGPPNVDRAVAEHDEVLDSLARGDLDAACASLAGNLRSGKEPIVEWLRSRRASE